MPSFDLANAVQRRAVFGPTRLRQFAGGLHGSGALGTHNRGGLTPRPPGGE
jgi:hypothetical protein